MVNQSLGARVRILDAAEALFAEQGFDATATAKIATHAAVPKGLLFYYFPTKYDVLRTLVGERLNLPPIDAAMLAEPGNPVASLLNLSTKLRDIESASEVLRIIIWREQHTHPEVKANLLEHRKQIQSVVERVLHASVLGPIAAIRLRAAAQAWVAILSSRSFDKNTDTDTDEPFSGLQALAELICDGLTGAYPARMS